MKEIQEKKEKQEEGTKSFLKLESFSAKQLYLRFLLCHHEEQFRQFVEKVWICGVGFVCVY